MPMRGGCWVQILRYLNVARMVLDPLRVRDLTCPTHAGVEEWQWARVVEAMGDEIVARPRSIPPFGIVMRIDNEVFDRVVALLKGETGFVEQDPDWWKA